MESAPGPFVPKPSASAAVLPVAPYLGSKRRLASKIIACLAAIEHTTYVEPFVGMGGVFFRRPLRSRSEVINDINGDVATPARFDVVKLAGVLKAAHERLSSVVIERLPYADLIARYDRPETLFYLDPPYWGSEGDYNLGIFSRKDFECLAGILRSVRGRFLLSLNDHPAVRKIFEGFPMDQVITGYTVGTTTSARKPVGEMLISNR